MGRQSTGSSQQSSRRHPASRTPQEKAELFLGRIDVELMRLSALGQLTEGEIDQAERHVKDRATAVFTELRSRSRGPFRFGAAAEDVPSTETMRQNPGNPES